jgi:inhibitor of KinA sporulation pathway (predicted exonuclease)
MTAPLRSCVANLRAEVINLAAVAFELTFVVEGIDSTGLMVRISGAEPSMLRRGVTECVGRAEGARSIVFFDTEYTAWQGSMERNWTGAGEHREILQIGAVRVDRDFAETDLFNVFVKPSRNPVLSQYIQNLTGITQARIDQCGIHFLDAWREFSRFLGQSPTVAYSNGGDETVIAENLMLHGEDGTTSCCEFHDIQTWFRAAVAGSEFVEANGFLSALGLEQAYREHDALGDARTIAQAVRVLQRRGSQKLPHCIGLE